MADRDLRGGLREGRGRPPRLSVRGPRRPRATPPRCSRLEARPAPGSSSRSRSGTCRADPSERKKLGPLVGSADALVAFVFGGRPAGRSRRDRRAGPPVVGRVRPAGRAAEIRHRRGRVPRTRVPRSLVEPLSGKPASRVRERPLRWRRRDLGVHLTARAPVRHGRPLARGGRSRRLPAAVDLRDALPARIEPGGQAPRPGPRGRLRRSDRGASAIFAIAALEDVLSGRSLDSGPRADVASGGPRRDHRRSRSTARTTPRSSSRVETGSRSTGSGATRRRPARRLRPLRGLRRAGQPGDAGPRDRVRLFETLVAPLRVDHAGAHRRSGEPCRRRAAATGSHDRPPRVPRSRGLDRAAAPADAGAARRRRAAGRSA